MGEGRVRKSAQNMVTGFLYQALTLVLSFVSRTVFIRALGTEYLGLNGIFSDVLSLLSMADLGLGTAMAYSFYRPLALHDEKQIALLIAFYKKIYNFIAAAVLLLGLICVPFLKYIINTETDLPGLEVYYLFSLAGVVISYLFVYKTTLLTADQKNYKLVRINMCTGILKTVLQILVLVTLKNYILYLAVGVVVLFINNIAASAKAEQEYPYIKGKSQRGKLDAGAEKLIFGNMKSMFIYKMSSTMFSATDNIIMSMVVGTAMVGLYSNYLMISNKLLLMEQIIFSALTASVGNVIVKESAAKRLQIFQAMQSASFIFCGIICSVFCLLVNDVIKVWLGGGFTLSVLTVIAVSLNTYFSCVMQPLWIYRDATGIFKKTKYVMLAGALLNIGLSFLMGHLLGLPGIIFASVIARLATYFWYEPKLLYREYFDSSAGAYYRAILKNVVLVAATVLVLAFLMQYFKVNSFGMLAAKGILTGGICCTVFVAAYARTEGFQIIWNKVKEIFSRKE